MMEASRLPFKWTVLVVVILAFYFQPAKAQPALLSFSLNMTPPEELLLTFSTAVGQSCNSQQLTLQNDATVPTASITFQSAACMYRSSSEVLNVILDDQEWMLVQADINLATLITNTYISLGTGFVLDADGMSNPSVFGLQVNTFTPNVNPPTLIGGLVDIETRLLGLLFSEGININSVVPTGISISFINMLTGMRQNHTLTGGNPVVIDTANQVGILLVSLDSEVIRLSSSNPSDFFISIASNIVTDANGTPNQRQDGVVLFDFIPDVTPPNIDSFTLDLNSGSMNLIFTEVIQSDPGNIDYSGINITREGTLDLEGFSLDETVVVSVSSINVTTIAIQLPVSLFNTIINDVSLCSSLENCFITWGNDTFRDLNNNPTFQPPFHVQASTIFPDTTSPNLTSFSIDLSSGLLNLSFSEPVNVTALILSDIRFTDGSSQQAAVNGTVVDPGIEFSVDVSITLSTDSLNFAKSLITPRLAIDSTATEDIAGNVLRQIDTLDSLTPLVIVPDQTPPVLLGFTPTNLPTPLLTLTFDEFVNPTRWNGNQLFLTLQVSAGDVAYSSFTSGTVSSATSDLITYTFSPSEFAPPFSDQYVEAYNSGTIVLRTDDGLIEDTAGNRLAPSGPFMYSTQPPDTTRPTLVSFDLNMNAGQFIVTFSEPINIMIIAGQVQFIDNNNISAVTQVYNLASNGTLQSGVGPLPVVDITLDAEDLNAIKVNTFLGSSSSNTYIIVGSGFGVDRSGNPVQPSDDGIQVSSYTQDTLPPTIVNATLDLNGSQLVLQLSEPIVPVLDFSQVSLVGSIGSTSGINITGSTIITGLNFDTLIMISLTDLILNSIKFSPLICTDILNCYIYSGPNSYRDTSGNIVPTNTAASQVTTLIPDTTPPSLISYDLDLNAGIATMTFIEPVDSVTFNPTGLTFVLLSLSSSGPTYSPADAFVTRTDSLSTIITLDLGASLNQVKQLNANSPGNLGLLMSSSTARDLAMPPNSVLEIDSSSPSSPASFVPDVTPPMMTNFIPSANESDVTFVFSEYVNSSTLQESQFIVRLSTLQGIFEYSGFSGGGMVTSAEITDQITYRFSQSDFNATLREQYSGAITSGLVSLLVGSEFVTDLNGNALLPISSPLQFSTDTVRPMLVNFTLDLNLGLLDLSFSEAVNILSVATMVRLQNSADSPTAIFSLAQNGTVVPPSVAADAIVIFFSQEDNNGIKTNQDIGTSIANTYLSLEETLARDLSGNLLAPDQDAVQAFSVILDISRPSLTSSAVDIDLGTVMLQFSESITTATLDLSRIYLTGEIQNQPSGYNLSGSTHVETMFSINVLLQLSQSVLNMIKSDTSVCATVSDCFIFISEGALSDVSGNPVIPSSSSVPVATIIPDGTPPTLMDYTLDLNSGIIILTFSEPITISGFMPSGITALAGSASVHLGDVSILGTEFSGSIVRLMAGSGLLNQLKVLSSLGSIAFSVNSNTVTDTNSLSLIPIPPSSSLAPSVFVADSNPPVLLQFIPSSGGQLEFTLVFDEFVGPNSLASNLLSFRLKNRNGHFDYADLSSAVITPQVSSDRIALTFPLSETRFTTNSFQQLYLSSYNEGSICLNLATSFVSDVNSNRYAGDLLIVYTNSSDTERPRFISFTLNLNTSFLNLTFSESVTVLAVAGNAIFQDRGTSPVSVYNIMQNGTIVASQGAPSDVVTIALDASDLNNLISNPLLVTSTLNTYLRLMEPFAVDFSGNLLADPQNIAIQASQVTQLITGTMLISFDLDLDSDIMTLQFDRGVNVSTFDSNRITLTNTSSPSAVERSDVQLSNVEVIAMPGSILSRFRFLLRVNDSINIKSSVLCYDRFNCFASVMSGLVLDATGNGTTQTTLQVSTLLLDVTPPRLIAYTNFDLNRGTFVLIFNEPVNSSSADFTDIQFADRVTNPTTTVTLREGFTSRDHIEIDFFLTNADLNVIKLMQGLCTSRDNCWVRLPSFFINDIGMNPFLHSNVQPDAQASFHQPLVFISDVTSPALVSFNLDINSGNMTLLFSEVVLDANFYPENITLLNGPSGSVRLQLSDATNTSRSSTGDEIYVYLTTPDLNMIKSLQFTSETNTFISIITDLLIDTSGNIFISIPPSDAVMAGVFVTDFTPPSLVRFDLYNNDNGSIIISFDEPVDIDTLDLTQITLLSQSTNIPQAQMYTLTGGTFNYLFENDELTLNIMMNPSDLREVKLITNLATAQDNTYISITNGTVSDRYANAVVSILVTTPLQLSASGFISDSSRASLAGYTFDLNNATISLTFTDVLAISSLDVTQLTIQNARSSPTESYTLVDSTTVSENSDRFDVILGSQDLNAIKLNLGLATSVSNTYISFVSSLIRDVSGLEVISVPSSVAFGAVLYFEDMGNPELISFDLDMNSGMVMLTFSEPVLVNTSELARVTIQNSGSAVTSSYELTGGTNQASGDTTLILTFSFIYSDLNQIKRILDLASGINDTYIQVTEELINDTNGNRIQATTLPVQNFIPDTLSPTLVSFDLNLTTSGILRLEFSEAISYARTIIPSTVQLQNSAFNPSEVLSLTTADLFMTLPILDTVEVVLRPVLLVALLRNPSIAASTDMLYISIITSTDGFRDFSGNNVVEISSNQAQRVRYIYRQCFDSAQYNNISQGICDGCSSLCVDTCTGSQAIAGEGGCDACHVIIIRSNGTQESCLPEGSTCPPDYFDNTRNSPLSGRANIICQPCSSECLSCNGPLSTDCQSCTSAFTTSNPTGGPITECLTSCSQASDSTLCQTCHPQCSGCTGLTNQDCVSCRQDSIMLEGDLTCVPGCVQHEYLARLSTIGTEYECQTCHDQCINCTGAENTECLQCVRVNSTINSVSTCMDNCPENTFETAGTRLCQPCHVQCSGGCRGPSNRNCTSCLENSVQIGGGVVECTPFCSLGMEYRSNACRLTLTSEIIIIVCSIAGGLIILAVLFVILCLCYTAFSSTGKLSMSKEVYFLGAKDKEDMVGKDFRSHTTGL